jgi:phospholipid/cholesterol/gamma-HCH transport system substrate-binding protein
MKLEAKIGLFIFTGFIALFVLSIQLGTVSNFGKEGYKLFAKIPNAGGLALNTKVKINGVEIGYIEAISLEDGAPLITLFIKNDIKISDNSTIYIKQESLLAGRFIEIAYGDSPTPLQPNATLSKTHTYASFDETSDRISVAADEFRRIVKKFDSLFDQAFVTDFKSTMRSFREMANSMNHASGEFEVTGKTINERLPDILRQIDDLTHELNSSSVVIKHRLPTILDNVNDFSYEFKAAATTLKDKLPKTFEGLSQIEGELHNILTENRTNLYSTLDNASDFFHSGDEAIHKVNDLIDNISSAKLEMNVFGEYMMSDAYMKSSFVVAYIPELSNYYLLEVISAPNYTKTDLNGAYTPPVKHESGKYLVSAMMGKQYDNLILRGGIKESTGGVGIDYNSNFNALRISFDIFDLNAVNDIRGIKPHLKLGMRYRPIEHIDIMAGMDNFINKDARNLFIGFGINFIDDNLKYLLFSAAGSAR